MNIKSLRLAAYVTLLAIALTSSVMAQGKGNGHGGGGNNPPPEGTIYFRHNSATWTMNTDGSAAAPLPSAPESGEPSHLTHDNQRWFLVDTAIGFPTPYFPNGGWDVEICAQSENGTSVLLLNEPDIEVLSPPTWIDADGSVSFIGERWALDLAGEPTEVVEAGLYRFDVVYDLSGAVAGIVPGSLSFLADLSFEMQVGLDGFDTRGEIAGHSWSADQSKFSVGIRAWDIPAEIWIVDLTLISDPNSVPPQALELLDSGDGIGWPEWSPDGRRIGYISWTGTVLYDLDKNRKKILRNNTNIGWGTVTWSPSGSHFVTYRWDKNLQTYDGIYRFTNGLGDQTLLSDGLCDGTGSCVLIPTGWRE